MYKNHRENLDVKNDQTTELPTYVDATSRTSNAINVSGYTIMNYYYDLS